MGKMRLPFIDSDLLYRGAINGRYICCFFREITQLLHADNLVRSNNVHLLRGIVQLGRLLIQNTDIKDCMSGQDVLHT
jgi:hypothetical protein